MKKFVVAFTIVFASVFGLFGLTGCKVSNVTTMTSGNWTKIKRDGEVIYDGPTEFIDDQYEKDALDKSEFNFIYDYDKGEFQKTKRGSTVFDT